MSILVRSVAVVFALASFALACSSSTSGTNTSSSSGGTSGGSPKVSTADCQSRCAKKAGDCGAPAADATSGCSTLCNGSFTDAQLVCLEGSSCSALQNTSSLAALCPDNSGSSSGSSGTSGSSGGGNKKALGDACTCAGVSANSEGLCSGTNEECGSGLSCVYASGSSGKGTCMGASCCETTSACDKDKSLLLPCTAGTCKSASIGYYCQK